LPWKGFESCLTASTDYNNRMGRGVCFLRVLVDCVERYGVEEEFLDATDEMESIQIKRVMSNTTDGASPAEHQLKCDV